MPSFPGNNPTKVSEADVIFTIHAFFSRVQHLLVTTQGKAVAFI